MGTAYDWSTTASSNGAADATINFAEGQAPSTVNDAARALMARVKAWLTQQGGVSSGGSSNAYTYTSPSGHAFSALTTNSRISFKANHSNTGAATLAVDGLTATAIRKNNGATALVTGDIISGQIYDVVYDGTYWVLLGVSSVGVYQPLDADLTAIAALGYTSGEYIIKKTAADTWALITITTAGAALLDDADAAAQRTTLGLGTGDSPQFTAVNIGAATDTTVTRVSAGVIAVEGSTLATEGRANVFTANQRVNVSNSTTAFLVNGGTKGARFNVDGTRLTIEGVDNTGTGSYQPLGLGGSQIDVTIAGSSVGGWDTAGALQAGVAVSSETSGTLTTASRNKQVRASGGVTVPASVFATDNIIIIRGMGTARTITRGSGLTMYVNGTDSATATLTARGTMSVVFDSATVCTLHGDVS